MPRIPKTGRINFGEPCSKLRNSGRQQQNMKASAGDNDEAALGCPESVGRAGRTRPAVFGDPQGAV